MFCSHCGNQLPESAKFCGKCGKPINEGQPRVGSSQYQRNPEAWQANASWTGGSGNAVANRAPSEQKCIPSFVLGLIAGLMGICGGYCMTVFTGLVDGGNAAFLLILLPSIIGLVGACLCFKRAVLGSLLQLIPAVTILIKGWFTYSGAGFSSIFAMLLFFISAIVGLIMTRLGRSRG